MDIKYTLDPIKNEGSSIFLAGPTLRTDSMELKVGSWRNKAVDILDAISYNGTVYIPEFNPSTGKPTDWTYERQVSWEVEALNNATIILFWIPRDLDLLPGFTTNIEFGEWLNSGKIVIGAPENSEKNKYLQTRCDRLEILWYYNLLPLINAAIGKIKINSEPKINVWFTSDTHFGTQRTLELSKRPFLDVDEMDWTMIKNWNMKISNNDIVYHLGDFGDPSMLKYLKCDKIYFLPGNYDKDDILEELQKDPRLEIIKSGHKYNDLILIHEPDSGKDGPNNFYLYGHIHRLQVVKKNGLNIGVDGNHYTPFSIEDVMFQKNAIDKGYYDDNVFMQIIGG